MILQGKVTISIYKFSVNNIVLYYIQLSHNKNLDFSICFFNRKCKNINQLITIKNDHYRWQDDNSTFLCNWECFYNTKLLWGIETYDAAAFAQKFLNLTNELRDLKLILGCSSYFLSKNFVRQRSLVKIWCSCVSAVHEKWMIPSLRLQEHVVMAAIYPSTNRCKHWAHDQKHKVATLGFDYSLVVDTRVRMSREGR